MRCKLIGKSHKQLYVNKQPHSHSHTHTQTRAEAHTCILTDSQPAFRWLIHLTAPSFPIFVVVIIVGGAAFLAITFKVSSGGHLALLAIMSISFLLLSSCFCNNAVLSLRIHCYCCCHTAKLLASIGLCGSAVASVAALPLNAQPFHCCCDLCSP